MRRAEVPATARLRAVAAVAGYMFGVHYDRQYNDYRGVSPFSFPPSPTVEYMPWLAKYGNGLITEWREIAESSRPLTIFDDVLF